MMDLYHMKQQFTLGAYRALVNSALPDSNSPDYIPALIYHARSHMALNDPKAALQLLPKDSESVAVKAAISLANYLAGAFNGDTSLAEASLEELRDAAIEIESDEALGSDREKAIVRVLAGTGFVRAEELEEALETLGIDTEDLEAVSLIVQIYLSIHRPDLAKKQFERSKRWAEDDLLLQLIESSIDLVTGRNNYANANSFYTEQLGNPSLTSTHILTSRGVTRILRNEFQEARSDLEEALEQQNGDEDTLAALVVSSGLGTAKKEEANELWTRLVSMHPAHPLVLEVSKKESLFDECAAKFTVPPLAA